MTHLFDALGESIAKEFAHRRCEVTRRLFMSPDAAHELAGAMLQETAGRHALVLFDTRTREVAGEACVQALGRAGWRCTELLVEDGPDGASPVCDDVTHDRLARLALPADALIAVGSGVINDLTKWLAAEASVPYAVVATAASMNGYAASNVAPTLQGVKSLFRAHAPRIIAAIPSVIQSAPWNLTSSGLGDAIAKPVSTADWIMNHNLFDEPFSQPVADIINLLEPGYLDHPEALAGRQSGAIQGLFRALVHSGCAMTLQGSSLPASGGEHLISHTLDMLAQEHHEVHALHGRQVGVATIFVAAIYQRMMAMDRPVFCPGAAPFDPAVWGSLAPWVRQEHERKRARVKQACQKLSEPNRWDALRSAIAPTLRPPRVIKDCLARSAAAHRVSDLGCTRERFLTAVRHCGAMRARLTSIDLAWMLGVLPDAADEIVDEWLL